TEDFQARIADLGEARVMAEDHAMTIVGTPGYTAPEVLRGEHYDTSADVFSFAIVMCELMTLRAPYSDLMKNDEGESLLTWSQITAMTQKKDGGLRPSLPDEMDDEMVRLVRESWSGDAALRPSFSVIVVRLEGIRRRGDRSSKSQDLRIHIGNIADHKKRVLSLCRGMHD
ncbi:MAG: protein kinase, partial [Bosea sp.]|nr:protein kinase [Bosea sp. (in: a-proteobacteria)]